MSAAKAFAIGVSSIVLVGLLAVGLWLGGWWLNEDAVNRQTRIDRRSSAFVQGRVDRARDDVLEVQALPDGGQRTAIVRGICQSLADIPTDSTPSDLVQFVAANC